MSGKKAKIISVWKDTAAAIRFCGALLDRTDSDIVDRIIDIRIKEITENKIPQYGLLFSSKLIDVYNARREKARVRKTFQLTPDSIAILKGVTEEYKKVISSMHDGIVIDYFTGEIFYRLFGTMTATTLELTVDAVEKAKKGVSCPEFRDPDYIKLVKDLANGGSSQAIKR